MHIVDCTFGGGLSRLAELACASPNGRNVENGPPAAFLHLGNAKMRHQIHVHAADVHHHALVPSVKICLEHRTEAMNRGSVDDYV